MDRANASLLVLSGATAGNVVEIRTEVTIGSASDCDLVLPAADVAHCHATIELRGSSYRLTANAPTFIGDRHEPPRAVVEADLPTICMIDFGTTSVMFEIFGGAYKGEPTIHSVPRDAPAFSTPQIAIGLNRLHRQTSGAGVAMVDDDRVLVAGGMPPMRGPGFATAELFSLRAHEGRDIAMTTVRSDCQAARLADGRVLVIGGNNSTSELFDPRSETFSRAPSLTFPRQYASLIGLPDGRAVALGGHREVAIEIFEPGANRWATVRGPTDRGATVAFEYGDAVVVAPTKLFAVLQTGGVQPRPPQRYYLLDLRTWKWDRIGESAVPRNASVLAGLPSGRALVIGGIIAGRGYCRDVDMFDVATGTLASVGSLLADRCEFAAVGLATGQALVAGGGSLRNGLYSAEIFDATTRSWRGLPALRDGFAPVGLAARADGSVVGVSAMAVSLFGGGW